MECKVCEYSCGCIETCKLKSSECYQNKKSRMNDIRKKAIKFEAEMYGVATNQFVDGFMNGYQQGKADAFEEVIKLVDDELTSDIGMDLFVDRDLLCERLEQLKGAEE